MLNGLDLFSGIGGLTLALSEWVRPIAYCEIDRYAQAVLLSRMQEGHLPRAPIWDDVATLDGKQFRGQIDIIYGGFPCQDISVAGNGKGLAGNRSWLFREIMRLAEEIKPKFLFLENVPAIRTRGLEHVAEWIASSGYDCRWDFVSAQEVGAPHIRQRWFCLAHANGQRLRDGRQWSEKRKTKTNSFIGNNGEKKSLANADRTTNRTNARAVQTICDETSKRSDEAVSFRDSCSNVADASSARLERSEATTNEWKKHKHELWNSKGDGPLSGCRHWAIEPNVGRVVNGLPYRVDRLKGLGNAVVPRQAKEAFMRLSGINEHLQKMG